MSLTRQDLQKIEEIIDDRLEKHLASIRISLKFLLERSQANSILFNHKFADHEERIEILENEYDAVKKLLG